MAVVKTLIDTNWIIKKEYYTGIVIQQKDSHIKASIDRFRFNSVPNDNFKYS